MGILDDAIREHLQLKRRLGAGEDELKRLEDEAFGPPTRPGEPDFPESEQRDQEAPEAVAEEFGAGRPATVEDEAATAVDEPPVDEPELESPPAGEPDRSATLAPVDEAAPTAEPAAAPQPEPPAADAEREAPYDHAVSPESESELELELELDEIEIDLDEELALTGDEPSKAEPNEAGAAAEAPAEPATEAAGTVEQGAPIEAEDTVEHEFAEAIDEPEVELDEVEPAPADEGPEAGEEDGDEDVLEETPEFLRERPEDDELWFEQGEPKDFDF